MTSFQRPVKELSSTSNHAEERQLSARFIRPNCKASLSKRLQCLGLIVVDCEHRLEMADPECVVQNWSQTRELELALGVLNLLRKLDKLAEHGTRNVLNMREIKKNTRVTVV